MTSEFLPPNEDRHILLERKVQEIEADLRQIKSWLRSEFGYDSDTTGNVWRAIDEARNSVDRLNDTVWKGNGRPSLQDQIGQINAKLNLIAAIAVLLSPLTVVFVEIALKSIRS